MILPSYSTLLCDSETNKESDQSNWYIINEKNTTFSKRVWELKELVQKTPQRICLERAILVDKYYKNKENRVKPP